MQEQKTKILCPGCGAAFMVRMARLPQSVTELDCSKCHSKIPLLERLLPKPGASGGESERDRGDDDQAIETGDGGNWGGSGFMDAGIGVEARSLVADDGEDDGAWLAIYGDLMSLLLVFFVLLFAISTIDRHKFDVAISSISSALGGPGPALFKEGGREGGANVTVLKQVITERQKDEIVEQLLSRMQTEQASLEDLKFRVQLLIDSYELTNEFEIVDEPDAVVVVVRDAALFDSGSADLNERYRNPLWEIGYALSQLPNKVVVEGHTDDRPISNARFASNWELSTARATSVVRLFLARAEFPAERIASSGVAYFRPRYPMQGETARLNRRIEIRIQKRFPAEMIGNVGG